MPLNVEAGYLVNTALQYSILRSITSNEKHIEVN